MTPRGGKREGAGRKPGPLGRAIFLPLRVPSRLFAALEAEAQARGVTRSELVVAILRRAMQRRGRL